jgi:hypothetical protein
VKKTLPDDVERGRVGGDRGAGPYGAFKLTHPVTGRTLNVIASDGRDWAEAGLPGGPWEHVSVSHPLVCPNWAEMCWIKGLFWDPEDLVLQFHPPASVYVNVHPRTLHLWAPVGVAIPLPPRECV